ncbi:MAG: metal-binding protein [Phyllobacteriaceae bacterium]|nr:metal-binding protein [Phyllobacteriaceae bacterium]MBA93027.1 metal-binding protein [Phyllobacteriaceae bacterium]
MFQDTISRRGMLIGSATVLFAGLPRLSLAQSGGPSMHVLKDPNCGCCSAWIEILERDGFSVTLEASEGAVLARYKSENGIPQSMVSCHTGRIDGYMVEGHVPVADIRRLLMERPDAIGLAVPGMPYGSPGMGPESEREAYDVFLIRHDGSTEVFTSYNAA